MAEATGWLLFLVGSPALCAIIAHARGFEWWTGALLGLIPCAGLVMVCVMNPRAGAPAVAPPHPGAQWAADPTGRHQLRLWDGRQWTANVSDIGRSGWDPLPEP